MRLDKKDFTLDLCKIVLTTKRWTVNFLSVFIWWHQEIKILLLWCRVQWVQTQLKWSHEHCFTIVWREAPQTLKQQRVGLWTKPDCSNPDILRLILTTSTLRCLQLYNDFRLESASWTYFINLLLCLWIITTIWYWPCLQINTVCRGRRWVLV